MRRLAVLGSTGSIGVNTLHIVRQFPERFEVVGLSAGVNIQLLKEQILQFRPKVVSVLNKELSDALRRDLPHIPAQIVHGVEGLIQVATHPEVDQVVSAIVGAVGLIPTLPAVKTGKAIALANKSDIRNSSRRMKEDVRVRMALEDVDRASTAEVTRGGGEKHSGGKRAGRSASLHSA